MNVLQAEKLRDLIYFLETEGIKADLKINESCFSSDVVIKMKAWIPKETKKK
jgi:hypothetical protein